MTTRPSPSERLAGVHAATVCPLDGNGRIDEDGLVRHVTGVATTAGIRGLLINGHAGEGPLLSLAEKSRVLAAVRGALPETFVCAGVTSEATEAAVAEAEAAGNAGADAVLVFPPASFALGHDTPMAVAHHQAIAAVGLPVVLYRAPITAGRLAYDLPTLARLADIDAVVGIKEGSWEVAAYEEVRRTLKAARPELAVLASGDEHLMTGFLVGSDGAQVSLAAIVPNLIVELFATAKAGDWVAARRLHDLIYPIAIAIYRKPPAYRATARLKCCLAILNAITEPTVKQPMQLPPPEEWTILREALEAAKPLPASR